MHDRFHDHCGVFGIFGHEDAAHLTYLGLHALQHRGQEAAGIVTVEGKEMRSHRQMGLVGEIFDEEVLARLSGRAAIGHVRYSTSGASELRNAQPLVVEYAHGPLALCHNGNLINARGLRDSLESHGAVFQSTMDTEVVLHLLAACKAPELSERIVFALSQLYGAYSLLFLSPDQLIALRDPYGFRPLVLGKLRDAHVLSSEDCAFDLIGARRVREVKPGEMLVIDGGHGLRSFFPFEEVPPSPCLFEWIYFARADSTLFERSVYQARWQMGRLLALEDDLEADLVVPVPDSGYTAALGYAEARSLSLQMGLVRSHYERRTFLEPRQAIRHFGVRLKFNAVRSVVDRRRVVLIDDSLVRGTTARKIVKMIRAAGAREVHLRIASPPILFPCYYGIDTPTRHELIASNHTIEEINRYLTSNSLAYLSSGALNEVIGGSHPFCQACFTGDYPIRLPRHGEHSTLGVLTEKGNA